MNWKKVIWDAIVGNFGKSTSVIGQLNWTDVLKIARTAALVGVTAAVGYATGVLQDVNWGVVGPIAVAGLEALQRLLKDNKSE